MYKTGICVSIALALSLGCSGQSNEQSGNLIPDNLRQLIGQSERMDYPSFKAVMDNYVEGASEIWDYSYDYFYLATMPYSGIPGDMVRWNIGDGAPSVPGLAWGAHSNPSLCGRRKTNKAREELDEYYRKNGGLVTVALNLDCVKYYPDRKEAYISGPDIPIPFLAGKDLHIDPPYPEDLLKIFIRAYPVLKLNFDNDDSTLTARVDIGPVSVTPQMAEKLEKSYDPGILECVFRLGSIKGQIKKGDLNGADPVTITVEGLADIGVPYLELLAAAWIVDGDTLACLTDFENDPSMARLTMGLDSYCELPIAMGTCYGYYNSGVYNPRKLTNYSNIKLAVIRR